MIGHARTIFVFWCLTSRSSDLNAYFVAEKLDCVRVNLSVRWVNEFKRVGRTTGNSSAGQVLIIIGSTLICCR